MKRILLALTAFLFLACGISTAQADIIAYTGFEEATASSGKYTGSGTEGEALPTLSTATTSYSGTYTDGGELGFETYLISGEGPSVGSENGDYIGVSDYYAYSGNNGYEMEDVDDQVQLVLETVDLTDYTDVTVSAYLKVALNSYSDYEDGDIVQMYVETDLGTSYLAYLEGEEVLDALVEDGYVYYQYSVSIADEVTSATFVFDVTSNGSGEGGMIDDVYFEGTYSAVPVPAAVWLLGSSLLAVVGMRRKNS